MEQGGDALDLLTDVLDGLAEPDSNTDIDPSVGNHGNISTGRSLVLSDFLTGSEAASKAQENPNNLNNDLEAYRSSQAFIQEVSGVRDEDDEDIDNTCGSESAFGKSHSTSRASFTSREHTSWKKKIEFPKELKQQQQKLTSHASVDTLFGMRIMNPLVSSQAVDRLMQGRKFVSIVQAKHISADKEPSVDWVVVGAIVNKSQTRTSKSGSSYTVWRISDLKPSLLTVSVFLFGAAYSTHWKNALGTVVGILNPKLMSGREGYSSGETSLSVNLSDKLLVIGTAKDYGLCQARKKDGSPCTSFVNTHDSSVCLIHLASEYRKSSRHFVSPSSSRITLQNKILGKNEIFYGGKSYVKTPAKQSPKQVAHDSKVLSRLGDKGISSGLRRTKNVSQPVKLGAVLHSPVTANRLRNNQATKDYITLDRLVGISCPNKNGVADSLLTYKKTTQNEIKKDMSIKMEENLPSYVMKDKIRNIPLKMEKQNGSKNFSSALDKKSDGLGGRVTSQQNLEVSKADKNMYFLEIEEEKCLENISHTLNDKEITSDIANKATSPTVTQNHSYASDCKQQQQSFEDTVSKRSRLMTEALLTDIPESKPSKNSNIGITGERDQENMPSFVMKKKMRGQESTVPRSNLNAAVPVARTHENCLSKKAKPVSSTQYSNKTEFYLEIDGQSSADPVPHIQNRNETPISETSKCSIPLKQQLTTTLHPRQLQARAKAKAVIQKFGPQPKKTNTGAKRKWEEESDDIKSEKQLVSQMEKFRQLMGVGSKHSTLVESRDQEAQEEYFDKLEKKEKLEEKMLTTYKVPCKAVRCSKCKYLAVHASEFCQSQGHKVHVVETHKRFYKCGDCGNRTVSLLLMPTNTCGRCGSSRWERTAMISERRGPKLTSTLSLRGGEEKFIGNQTEGSLDLLVPDN